MSQERIEAPAVTLCEQLWENAHERQKEYALEEATEVLAAADAVMFSDEAVERAKQVLHRDLCACDNPSDEHCIVYDDWTGTVRAVIAALKGDA